MKILLRNGEIFRHGRFERADLRIEQNKIAAIGSSLSGPADREIDATGLSIFPGFIDVHVHFREPGLAQKEGWQNGSKAAAHGGVCTVFEVQNNEPLSLDAARIQQRQKLASQGLVDFGCYGNLLPQALPKLSEIAPLVPAFKLFLGGSTGMNGIPERSLLKDLFQAAAAVGKTIVAHCEDETILTRLREKAVHSNAADHHQLRPREAERASIETAISLAEETKASLHVFHVTTAAGTALISEAKKKKLSVSASVSFHNLIFTAADTAKAGNYLKVNPPIQTGEDRDALREALSRGTIDALATDHAPHFREEKENPYAQAPSGIPSVDFFLPLLLSLVEERALSLERAVEAASLIPAQLFGIRSKGQIETGLDADLVLCNRHQRRQVQASDIVSRAGWSPYLGKTLFGFPEMTFVRGKIVFEKGNFFDGAWGKPVLFQ